MKYVILLIILKTIALIKIANSDDYQLEIFFTNKSESLNLSEDIKYIHINSRGVWKDSLGDYGNIKCFGNVLMDKKKGANLDAYCEATDYNNIKFWLRLQRTSDQRDAGVGSSTYLNGEDKYKKFIGKKCVYASKVFGIDAIVNQKCKIDIKN